MTIPDWPPNWWRYSAGYPPLTDELKSFVVGLFVSYRLNNQQHVRLFTGFLVKHGDRLLWVTAGHVARALKVILSDQSIFIDVIYWLDGHENSNAAGFPMHHRDSPIIASNDDRFDFGVVVITGLDAENIVRNKNNRVFDLERSVETESSRPEGYYLIGYPHELHEFTQTPADSPGRLLNVLRAKLIRLPVEKIECSVENTDPDFWDDPTAFYGQLVPYADGNKQQPADIDGMSGSPVFSVERVPNGVRRCLVGIQRGWLPAKRIIRVEPLEKVVAVLKL